MSGTDARSSGIVGIVLAAGEGTRLRPLTWQRPKPLCPILHRSLLDLSLDRVAGVTDAAAVNVCHGADQIIAHLDQRPGRSIHVSIEEQALGTAGAIARLRDWIAGRDALVVNGDSWTDVDLGAFVTGWDRQRLAVLVQGDSPLHSRSRVVASLFPVSIIETLVEAPSGLWETVWHRALAEDRLLSVGSTGHFVDCGTPADYLRANLAALDLDPGAGVAGSIEGSGRIVESVVGSGAAIHGTVVRSVIGPGVLVGRDEMIVDGVRLDDRMTLLVR